MPLTVTAQEATATERGRGLRAGRRAPSTTTSTLCLLRLEPVEPFCQINVEDVCGGRKGGDGVDRQPKPKKERQDKLSNNVTLIGNLVEDPELRFTPSGVAMARMRLAVNRRWRTDDGEWKEDTSFFTATLWRDQAEHAAESLQKGARVIVVGRLEQRSWETPEGDKRSVVEVQVDEIGPSLRWATAQVAKVGGSGGSSNGPSSQAAEDEEAPF